MTGRIELVPFESRQILTVRKPDDIYVVMKPVVAALGLDWEAQRQRIQRHPVINKGACVTQVPSAGGMQDAVALRLECFHGWLVSLNPERVKDEAKRAVIIAYQERAFRVIFEHFHGKMSAGRSSHQSVADRTALQNQILKLTGKLQRSRNHAERRLMHEMLDAMCGELGVTTPPLDQLGRDAPQAPDLLQPFWDGLAILEARGVKFNHSRDFTLIAINLPDLRKLFREAGLPIEIDTAMRKALQQSTSPAFMGAKTMNSRLEEKSKACWVFKRNDVEA